MPGYIVTVKLPRNPDHDPRDKKTGACPVPFVEECTDVTGEHHSFAIEAPDSATAGVRALRGLPDGIRVTRVEEQLAPVGEFGARLADSTDLHAALGLGPGSFEWHRLIEHVRALAGLPAAGEVPLPFRRGDLVTVEHPEPGRRDQYFLDASGEFRVIGGGPDEFLLRPANLGSGAWTISRPAAWLRPA